MYRLLAGHINIGVRSYDIIIYDDFFFFTIIRRLSQRIWNKFDVWIFFFFLTVMQLSKIYINTIYTFMCYLYLIPSIGMNFWYSNSKFSMFNTDSTKLYFSKNVYLHHTILILHLPFTRSSLLTTEKLSRLHTRSSKSSSQLFLIFSLTLRLEIYVSHRRIFLLKNGSSKRSICFPGSLPWPRVNVDYGFCQSCQVHCNLEYVLFPEEFIRFFVFFFFLLSFLRFSFHPPVQQFFIRFFFIQNN